MVKDVRFTTPKFRPSLEDDPKTHKPHKIRLSKHWEAQLETIKQLKEINPKIGKIRIAKIIKETGYKISPSTVFHLLTVLKKPV